MVGAYKKDMKAFILSYFSYFFGFFIDVYIFVIAIYNL